MKNPMQTLVAYVKGVNARNAKKAARHLRRERCLKAAVCFGTRAVY
jgi:hypothetical protein